MFTCNSLLVAGACLLALAACAITDADNANANGAYACSQEQRHLNENTVRIVFDEILSKGRIAENEHIYHRNFVARGMSRDATRAEDRAASEGWRKMAPDLKMTILRTVSDCNFVAVHFEGRGTNTGEGNGFPATGRPVRVRGMTFFRLENAQIVEEWTEFDQYELLKQCTGARLRACRGAAGLDWCLGVGGHRGLALAHRPLRRAATRSASRSTPTGKGGGRVGLRPRHRRREPVQGVRRRRHHAHADATAHRLAGRQHPEGGDRRRPANQAAPHFDRTPRPGGPRTLQGHSAAEWVDIFSAPAAAVVAAALAVVVAVTWARSPPAYGTGALRW